MILDLTQYKLLVGNDIYVDGKYYGDKADVSELDGMHEIIGSIISKHNHTIDSAATLTKLYNVKLKELKDKEIALNDEISLKLSYKEKYLIEKGVIK